MENGVHFFQADGVDWRIEEFGMHFRTPGEAVSN